MVVVQAADGSLKHFDWLGYVVVATTLLSLWLMYSFSGRWPKWRADDPGGHKQ